MDNGKTIKLNIILKPLLFVVFSFVFEIINFLWLKFRVTGNLNMIQILPNYIFFDLGVIIVIAGIIFVSGKIGGNVVMYVFLGLQAALNMINATLYKVFGDIFSFDMMKLGNEAVSAFKLEFISYWSILCNVLVIGIIIGIQILLDKKCKKEISLKRFTRKSLCVFVFFVALCFGVGNFITQTFTLSTGTDSQSDDKYLWNNMQFKLEAYKKFGTYGFYVKSLADLIYKTDDYSDLVRENLLADLENGKVDTNTNAEFNDDNLIVIMLESFEWFAIDPYNTPTLWQLRTQDAISFENYHSKNKTNMSENIVILGNMPKDTAMSKLAVEGSLNNQYSLPNLFREQGYTANYFHSYLSSFYERNVTMPAMGFEKIYALDGANLENKSTKFNDWNLDSDIVKYYINEMCPTDQKFFSFFLTVATHGSYAVTNERFASYYEQYDANLEQYKSWLSENTDYIYPTNSHLESCFRQYKCAAMDADAMVAYLLDYLSTTQDQNGNFLIDKTNILMYADHNCYYEDLYANIKGIEKSDFYDTYSYNVPCMLYSKKLEHSVNTTFVNTYDLFPTICSLYGLPYNTAITQGYNVFGDEIDKSVMISFVSGAFNENCYTLNVTDVYVTDEVSEDDLRHFRECVTLFYHKQHDIELMYRYGLLVKQKE